LEFIDSPEKQRAIHEMEHIGELNDMQETPRMEEIRDEEMKVGLDEVDKKDPMDPLMQQAHLEMRIDFKTVRKIWPYFNPTE
jgi:hypothetical protein